MSYLKATATNLPLRKIYFSFLFLAQFCLFHAIKCKLSLVIKVRELFFYLVQVEYQEQFLVKMEAPLNMN